MCLSPLCATITEYLRLSKLERKQIYSQDSGGWEVQDHGIGLRGGLTAVSSHGRGRSARKQAKLMLHEASFLKTLIPFLGKEP